MSCATPLVDPDEAPVEKAPKPPLALVGRLPERADGPLAYYLADLARAPALLSPAAELEAARAIAAAEAQHWAALLSHLPAARPLLAYLSGVSKVPQLGELLAMLSSDPNSDPTRGDAWADRWVSTSLALGHAIRLADSDRVWTRRANLIARDPLRFAGPLTRDYQAFLATVERTWAEQHAAKLRFITANLRLVISIARRYSRGRLPLADLVQEGNIGLSKAVEMFDAGRGFRFSTYAMWWIRHAISRALADKGRMVRIPVHMLDTYNRTTRAAQAVTARTGHEPTIEELAKESGVPREKLEKVRSFCAETPFSLDRQMGGEDGRTFLDFLTDDDARSPLEHLETARDTEAVRRALARLAPVERRVLELRFGLDGEGEETLAEVGERYGLTRDQAKRIEVQALDKLRAVMRV